MAILKIHPDFTLDHLSFNQEEVLLEYVQVNYPEHFVFLKELFSINENIQVLTSGSTGIPKTIFIKKKAMLKSAEATGHFFNLYSKITALICLSSAYIAGKMMWVRALHLGWHVSVTPTDSTPLQHIHGKFDFVAMVPLQVQNSLKELYRINQLIIGGAPLSNELKENLLALPVIAYQTYGMTETITHIAVKKITSKNIFYKALPNVCFSTDSRNCLIIEAPEIVADLVLTNDIVNLHSSTSFEWLGRYDNVVNSGGIKLFPEQIESKLSLFIRIPFFISSMSDTKLGNKLILIVESDQKIKALDLLWTKVGLSKFEIPKEIYYISKFSYTESQKIDRQKTLNNLM